MNMSELPIIVVGGGTAGSMVVASLAQSTQRDIVLIEPGNISPHDDKNQFLDALSSEMLWPNIDVSATSSQVSVPYLQARALGGGSAINGLLLSGEAPTELIELTRVATAAEIGPLSQAFIACGATPSRLWWNDGRWNPGRVVARLVEEARVTWIQETAEKLMYDQNHVTGVMINEDFVAASVVVMCAGALLTPALLLTSGIGSVNSQIGTGLQNHPTISFTLKKTSTERSDEWFDASVVLHKKNSNGQKSITIVFERLSRDDADYGIISASLLDVVSRGAVRLDNGIMHYEFNMLAEQQDVAAMRAMVRDLIALVQRPEFVDVIQQVLVDVNGTHLSIIKDLSDEDLDRWIFTHLTLVSHAASSCSQAVDSSGRVRGMENLFIADASVLETVPSETPAASVTIEALRIARIIGDSFR